MTRKKQQSAEEVVRLLSKRPAWHERAKLISTYHNQMISLVGQKWSRSDGWSMRKTAKILNLPLSQIYNCVTAWRLGCGDATRRQGFTSLKAFISWYEPSDENPGI